jgi:hypothetical protein
MIGVNSIPMAWWILPNEHFAKVDHLQHGRMNDETVETGMSFGIRFVLLPTI